MVWCHREIPRCSFTHLQNPRDLSHGPVPLRRHLLIIAELVLQHRQREAFTVALALAIAAEQQKEWARLEHSFDGLPADPFCRHFEMAR